MVLSSRKINFMKKFLLTIFCVLAIWPNTSKGDERLCNYDKRGLYATTVDEILQMREGDIDLGTAALIISENWSQNVYGRRYRTELDDMAQEILRRMRAKRIPANYNAINLINDYLFKELKFNL